MEALAQLITSSEDWLIRRVLCYAREREYVKYTSTLEEAWRLSISGLSSSLLEALRLHQSPPELHPDEDIAKDPMTGFGVIEAQKHRSRGISLGMFLGLMKYYRQSYVDLVCEAGFPKELEEKSRLFVDRFFDRVEMGFCEEWVHSSTIGLIEELQSTNRSMTNEKNKYLTIFESLANPVFLFDTKNELDNLNHAAAQLLGATGSPGGFYYGGALPLKSVPWLTEELVAFASGNEPSLILEKDFTGVNCTRHFQIQFKRMLDVSEKFRGTVVILTDLTERRQVEGALRLSEEKYRSFIQNASYGHYLCDPGGNSLEVNQALLTMLGYESPEEVLKLNFRKDVFQNPGDWIRLFEQLRTRGRIEGTGAERRGAAEFGWKRKDGTPLRVRLSGRRLCNQKGDIEGFEIIVENVHERRLLEKQFQQMQKMEAVARLAGGVAQDFGKLLAGIIESSNKLLDPLKHDHPMFEGVRAIKEAGERASELTSQLLALSRRQASAPVELDLNPLLVGMERPIRQLTMENIEVLIAPDIHPNHVLVDPTQIEQAILNLVSNAHASMPQGGTIMLETLGVDIDADSARSNVGLRPGPYTLLTVTDNGNGTDPEILPHIFEPFIMPGGKGMQLAVIYGVVKQNGGEIEVYSDLGLGTTFIIYLLRILKEAQPESGPAAERKTRGQAILLLEEARYLRALARRILAMGGYQVLEASRLDEAVALCKRHEGVIGLMITDVVMPEMMGREMAARIARIRPGIKVLFTTGFADDAMRSRGTLASGHAFITKPFTPGALVQKVREVLGTSDRAEQDPK